MPRETLFLWGAKQPWIAHSWGTQIFSYELLKIGDKAGAYLALVFTFAMLSLVLTLLWKMWSGRATVVTVLLFALETWCAATRARPRPELFSGVFFVLLLIFLNREQRSARWSWRETGVALMFTLWANMHGAVAAGLLLLFITTLCDLAQDYQEFRPFRWVPPLLAVACVAAVTVNPYGLEYWSALRPVGGVMFSHIDEWKPFWKAPALDGVFPAAGLVLAVFAALALASAPKIRWAHAIWLLVWLGMFLSARRNLWMMSIISLTVLAIHAEHISPQVFWKALTRSEKIPDVWRTAARWGVVIFLIATTLNQAPAQWQRHLPSALSSKLPSAAATHLTALDAAHSGLNILADYESSSYFHWRFGEQTPLFIDLLNAYPDQLMLDYFEMINATRKGRILLRKRKVNCVFLRAHKPTADLAKLGNYLDGESSWRRVYNGVDGAIWLKNS